MADTAQEPAKLHYIILLKLITVRKVAIDVMERS